MKQNKKKNLTRNKMNNYISINYKTTHLNVEQIKLVTSFLTTSSISDPFLNTSLQAINLSVLVKTLLSTNYLFDKMSCLSDKIEEIDYIYVASCTKDLQFIDSFDNKKTASDPSLFSIFKNDSNGEQVSSEEISYIEYESNTYIGVILPYNNYHIYIIVQTFQDDSVLPNLQYQQNNQFLYGFEIFENNQSLLKTIENSYLSVFEYAS